MWRIKITWILPCRSLLISRLRLSIGRFASQVHGFFLRFTSRWNEGAARFTSREINPAPPVPLFPVETRFESFEAPFFPASWGIIRPLLIILITPNNKSRSDICKLFRDSPGSRIFMRPATECLERPLKLYYLGIDDLSSLSGNFIVVQRSLWKDVQSYCLFLVPSTLGPFKGVITFECNVFGNSGNSGNPLSRLQHRRRQPFGLCLFVKFIVLSLRAQMTTQLKPSSTHALKPTSFWGAKDGYTGKPSMPSSPSQDFTSGFRCMSKCWGCFYMDGIQLSNKGVY
ncbi:predicted protein [Uncinocarpus reesii 1704]|uniref:Uncharacterized protein n=1 Tax=Uncinocarpus reesii (strain UAMH 1704) TaxID=336963 RepID=C4JID3_UNCRE|nr:uncharacterized protein UREG_02879 [Uncinocarpus reesii 1704]EEP78030.1 predicted protein [Uncinocarpus reesii 1704]